MTKPKTIRLLTEEERTEIAEWAGTPRTIKRHRSHKHFNWKTVDSIGSVCLWKRRPVMDSESGTWQPQAGDVCVVHAYEGPCKSWKSSLRKIEGGSDV